MKNYEDVVEDIRRNLDAVSESLRDGNFWRAGGKMLLAEAGAMFLYFRQKLHLAYPRQNLKVAFYYEEADRILERFRVFRDATMWAFMGEYMRAIRMEFDKHAEEVRGNVAK